jgi:predicted secreted protein
MKSKILILLVGVLILRCTGVEPGNMEIQKQENGKEFSLYKNSFFNVILDGNITTGYSWEIITIDTTKIKSLGYDYKPLSNKTGTPGQYTFKFKTLSLGTSIIKFYYLRTWEKGIAPADSFFVKINAN